MKGDTKMSTQSKGQVKKMLKAEASHEADSSCEVTKNHGKGVKEWEPALSESLSLSLPRNMLFPLTGEVA